MGENKEDLLKSFKGSINLPTLSVAIPVYNGEDTILETIRSVDQDGIEKVIELCDVLCSDRFWRTCGIDHRPKIFQMLALSPCDGVG